MYSAKYQPPNDPELFLSSGLGDHAEVQKNQLSFESNGGINSMTKRKLFLLVQVIPNLPNFISILPQRIPNILSRKLRWQMPIRWKWDLRIHPMHGK